MRPHLAARTIIHALFPAVLCLTLPACGDSGGDGNAPTGSSESGTCSIRADVAGGTSLRFTGKDDAACATLHSVDVELDAVFIGENGKGSLAVRISTVTEGETGTDFPTRVIVTSSGKEQWQNNGCLTSISEHRAVKVENSEVGELRHYQVSGEGTCTEPFGTGSEGSDPVTLGPFGFRAPFTWRD